MSNLYLSIKSPMKMRQMPFVGEDWFESHLDWEESGPGSLLVVVTFMLNEGQIIGNPHWIQCPLVMQLQVKCMLPIYRVLINWECESIAATVFVSSDTVVCVMDP